MNHGERPRLRLELRLRPLRRRITHVPGGRQWTARALGGCVSLRRSPHEQDSSMQIVNAASALLAVLVSATVVLAAVAQLTRTARLRKREAFLREAATGNLPDATRKQLDALRLRTVGEIIARDLISSLAAWRDWFLGALAFGWTVLTGAVAAEGAIRDDETWQQEAGPLTVTVALVFVVVMAVAVANVARRTDARDEIVEALAEGDDDPEALARLAEPRQDPKWWSPLIFLSALLLTATGMLTGEIFTSLAYGSSTTTLLVLMVGTLLSIGVVIAVMAATAHRAGSRVLSKIK